ncbi:hypothetical protein FRC03_009333 [Tulasnella sp. 419]|nr:hypothetical protein FRC03_009333 [Tulasnella sp. 419]
MGIPKFFRWISERYPLTSQLIQENKIPEFDNLYLDFNGIIHNCSHPNDNDAHFRIAQPDYNPNVRHCLYGLDADLMMLGLLSHDPHFCLLREEVKFGPSRKKSKSSSSLESQNFFLLHLSLLREYLDMEFMSMAANPETPLPFEYSFERVIDDFVLLAIFVGNDFLPNLPDLHIHENGLERLFEIYKRVLPKAGGYLVKQGTINLARLQLVLDELAKGEVETFQREHSDMAYYRGKQDKYRRAAENPQPPSQSLTKAQRFIFEQVEDFVVRQRFPPSTRPPNRLAFVNDFAAGDKSFLITLASEMNLSVAWDEFDDMDRNLVTLCVPSDEDEGAPVEDGNAEGDDEGEWEDVDAAESHAAVDRVLRKYRRARVIDAEGTFDEREDQRLQEKMDDWKRLYYKEKMEIQYDDETAMRDLVYRYVEGLQWVMYYYYSGVASWGWFYNYHYAPKISDLKGVESMSFSFELGQPFKPFEQLMGVLPEASKDLVPAAFRELMYDTESPILDFYPQIFEQDMNGKKAEWEAIVKIPFIDKDRLLGAMAARAHRLTPEEQSRNTWGPSTSFVYDATRETHYPSSLPGHFPAIPRCRCAMTDFHLPTLDGLHLIEGLCDGVFLGADALAGFPTVKTLPHTALLGYHGVNVFQADSRNQSMIISIQDQWEDRRPADVAREIVGTRVFTNWPFLQEGLVEAVSDNLFKYYKTHSKPHSPMELNKWEREAGKIEKLYSKRFGVLTDNIHMLVHVRPLKGMKRTDTGALVKDYEGPDKEVEQALQMIVTKVVSEDPRYLEKKAPPLAEEFPNGSKVIFLGEFGYGVAASVESTTETTLSILLAFFRSEAQEEEKLAALIRSKAGLQEQYYPAFQVARMLNISGLALAKITSSFMVLISNGDKTNLGLSLKFEAKGMKVLEYTRKDGNQWEFSEKAIDLIREYKREFPTVFSRLDARGDDLTRASDLFAGNADAQVKTVQAWLKARGVRDLEPVSLYTAHLTKDTIHEIEQFTSNMVAGRNRNKIHKAKVQGIPRQAVLKPSHAVYRLQDQVFQLGDRVTMVQDSGSVPLCAKGVVVGLNANSIDVVWDSPFMSGTTLGDRCSQYRGSTTGFNTCLNITNKQFMLTSSSGRSESSTPTYTQPPRQPQQQYRPGHYPSVQSRPGELPASGFRPAPNAPMQILVNPNRAGPQRQHWASGKGGPPSSSAPVNNQPVNPSPESGPSRGRGEQPSNMADGPTPNSVPHNSIGRGSHRGGRGNRGHRGHPGNHPPRGAAMAARRSPPVATNHLPTTVPLVPVHLHHVPARGRGGPRGRGGRGGFRGRGRGGNHDVGASQPQAPVPS